MLQLLVMNEFSLMDGALHRRVLEFKIEKNESAEARRQRRFGPAARASNSNLINNERDKRKHHRYDNHCTIDSTFSS